MKHISIFIVLIALLTVQLAYAIDTQINIKTLRDDKVSVQILDTDQVYYLLNSYHSNSGESGNVTVTYTGEEKKIDIKIQVSEDEKVVVVYKFEDIETGKPVYFRVFPGDTSQENIQELTNQTVNSTYETNQTSNLSINSGITGNVISNQSDDTKEPDRKGWMQAKKRFIIVGLVILGIICILIAIKIILSLIRKRRGYGYKTVKASEIENRMLKSDDLSRELAETKRKLGQAQSEITRLKNQDRIKEIERRIREEKNELDKLRRGF